MPVGNCRCIRLTAAASTQLKHRLRGLSVEQVRDLSSVEKARHLIWAAVQDLCITAVAIQTKFPNGNPVILATVHATESEPPGCALKPSNHLLHLQLFQNSAA